MEKPILFNSDMVRAILDGRKTQTRRIIKPKSKNAYGFYVTFRKSDNAFMGVYDYDEDESSFDYAHTPPCAVGDILWVRETWANTWTPDGQEGYVYKADGEPSKFPYWGNEKQCKDEAWIPSIHMPRAAARIFLKVKNVRVEQLQDITEEEAKKEGCFMPSYKDGELVGDSVTLFKVLWDSIYENWNENPWVWVIEFEKVEADHGNRNEV